MTAGKENEPRRKLALTQGNLGFLLTEDSTLESQELKLHSYGNYRAIGTSALGPARDGSSQGTERDPKPRAGVQRTRDGRELWCQNQGSRHREDYPVDARV